MSAVSWLGFGISSAVTKTFLHFLPAAAGVGAPYPVELKVSVGGSSLPRRSLTVDGARLGHPDGFRLEEAVPALGQHVSGLYLLEVELLPSQQRVDLSNSCIITEIQYQQAAVRYLPRRINPPSVVQSAAANDNQMVATGGAMSRGIFNPDVPPSTGFTLRDPTLFASLVVLNSSSETITTRIFSTRSSNSVGNLTLAPDSLKEMDLSDLGLNRPTKLDSTWGAIEVETFALSFERVLRSPDPSVETESDQAVVRSEPILGAAAAAYVVYRDRSSRRISSVVAL